MFSSVYLYSFILILWELSAVVCCQIDLGVSSSAEGPYGHWLSSTLSVLPFLGGLRGRSIRSNWSAGFRFWLLLALIWNDCRGQTDLGHKAITTLIIGSSAPYSMYSPTDRWCSLFVPPVSEWGKSLMREGWMKSCWDRVEKILTDREKKWLWISRYAAIKCLLHTINLFHSSQLLPDS